MSVKATAYVLHRRFGNPTRKLIMLAIADHANDSGEAWPSIENLAYKAECSTRSVQIHIQQLHENGEIQIQPPRPPRRLSNLYRIIFKNIESTAKPLSGKENHTPAESAPVQNSDESMYTACTPTRPGSSPEPLRTTRSPHVEREGARATASPDSQRLIHLINSVHKPWELTPALTEKEETAFRNNRAALGSLPPERWNIIRAYYAAKRTDPTPGAYRPTSREMFMRDIGDVVTHSAEWEERQSPATLRKPSKPPPTPQEEATAKRELPEWLAKHKS